MINNYPEDTVLEKLKDLSGIKALRSIIKSAVNAKYSLALWKLPQGGEKHLIIDLGQEANIVKADLEELPPGFIVSPFLNPDNSKSNFIAADLHFKINGEGLHSIKFSTDTGAFLKIIGENITRNIHTTPYHKTEGGPWRETSKEEFIKHVRESLVQINDNCLQKVVPSKLKFVYLSDSFDITTTFQKLCEAYPDAFVSLVSIPGSGTWLGASPEVLISVDRKNIFKTVSLAGTKKIEQGQPLQAVAWTQKEIEEQALVSRYIINCFKKIRLREFDEKGPKTVRAGNLVHLKTEFSVDMEAVNFPQLGTVMLKLLHPTSAVCGMPKEPALNFISDHEKFDRAFYSGFLGPVNINNESQLFVNLRCMQIMDKKAILYAGAGVTEDSDPEKEWLETEMKCQTLLEVLNSKQ